MLSSYKIQIIFVITGALIGAFITSQLRTNTPTSGQYPADLIQARNQLIKTYVDEQSALQSQIVSLRKTISENQGKNNSASQSSNLTLLDGLKKRIGLTQEVGEGVEIQVDDSPLARRETSENVSEALIHAADLRDIVNTLRSGKATAIAINNQRILATTPITSVGSSILVNNFYIVPPFTITAKGEAALLLQRLSDVSQMPDLYKRKVENGIQFSFKESRAVVIPVYNGDFRILYLTTAI